MIFMPPVPGNVNKSLTYNIKKVGPNVDPIYHQKLSKINNIYISVHVSNAFEKIMSPVCKMVVIKWKIKVDSPNRHQYQ